MAAKKSATTGAAKPAGSAKAKTARTAAARAAAPPAAISPTTGAPIPQAAGVMPQQSTSVAVPTEPEERLDVAKRPGGFTLRADGTPQDANGNELDEDGEIVVKASVANPPTEEPKRKGRSRGGEG